MAAGGERKQRDKEGKICGEPALQARTGTDVPCARRAKAAPGSYMAP